MIIAENENISFSHTSSKQSYQCCLQSVGTGGEEQEVKAWEVGMEDISTELQISSQIMPQLMDANRCIILYVDIGYIKYFNK